MGRKSAPSVERRAIRWVQQLGGLVVQTPPGAKTDDLPGLDGASLSDDGAKLTAYVDAVGKNLAAQSSRPSLPWTFAVLKNSSRSAYAAPGGIVLVSKGMLAQCENEAQLAGVLAHRDCPRDGPARDSWVPREEDEGVRAVVHRGAG